MFDPYGQELFEHLPALDGLLPEEARRMLSRAYLAVVERRAGIQEASEPDGVAAVAYLRRLAATLELSCILDADLDDDGIRAAAFVAAEALALVSDYVSSSGAEDLDPSTPRIRDGDFFTRIESGILYLLAEFDACAAGIVRSVKGTPYAPAGPWELPAEALAMQLVGFCRLDVAAIRRVPDVEPVHDSSLPSTDLAHDTFGLVCFAISRAVANFGAWLVGEDKGGLDEAIDSLGAIAASLRVGSEPNALWLGGDTARLHHLTILLLTCMKGIAPRALVYAVPPPADLDGEMKSAYEKYILRRVVGSEGGGGRPLLWPSALSFTRSFISDKNRHAVVSMPTGSGKSFLAELAISQSVYSGWCLYLTPTNALAHQVRTDLRGALREFGSTVAAFIGDQEYSTLQTDKIPEQQENTVAVMTPEKAFLALRLAPRVFENLSLVVFDECHLLADRESGRGATAEILLAQLMVRSPSCRFVLMSAMLANPDDLAGWLSEATGYAAEPLTHKWRPTRTLRAGLGVDKESVSGPMKAAQEKLAGYKEKIKRKSFEADLAVVGCLQGAWQPRDAVDYASVRLPCPSRLYVVRTKKRNGPWKYHLEAKSWVNGSAISIGSFLAQKGMQTLVFTPASRHHGFSNAEKTKLGEKFVEGLPALPSEVEACRVLSEYEYGTESVVFGLLSRGIAVHTSHMIEAEKVASEAAFRAGSARLMYATGTLAQGLNLPATAVVIAGSRIGDPRGQAMAEVERRKFSQLLNAAGRAGRAGFANQGLVVAIPDEPVAFSSVREIRRVRDELSYLQKPDSAVTVESSLDSFLDQVGAGSFVAEQATPIEQQAIAMLAGGGEGQLPPEKVLAKSYASFRRRHRGLPSVDGLTASHLESVREAFVGQPHVADWAPVAAQNAGLGFFMTVGLANAWGRVRPTVRLGDLEMNVGQWACEFLKVLSYVPPRVLFNYTTVRKVSRAIPEFASLSSRILDVANNDWDVPSEWISAWGKMWQVLEPWMSGVHIADIARLLSNTEAGGEISTARSAGGQPIPKALSVVHGLFSDLALIAGGFVAVVEQILRRETGSESAGTASGVPIELNVLPMCIKYGANSAETLAWYRFGIRLRRPSLLLAEAYPPPPGLSDVQLRDFVLEKRREWLDSVPPVPMDVTEEAGIVFRSAAEFIGVQGV